MCRLIAGTKLSSTIITFKGPVMKLGAGIHNTIYFALYRCQCTLSCEGCYRLCSTTFRDGIWPDWYGYNPLLVLSWMLSTYFHFDVSSVLRCTGWASNTVVEFAQNGILQSNSSLQFMGSIKVCYSWLSQVISLSTGKWMFQLHEFKAELNPLNNQNWLIGLLDTFSNALTYPQVFNDKTWWK